ncbi:MAG: hypothetical protein JWN03_4095 [Nocardia sp.]|nr:hypothetical protein [Nocardia sp.]
MNSNVHVKRDLWTGMGRDRSRAAACVRSATTAVDNKPAYYAVPAAGQWITKDCV